MPGFVLVFFLLIPIGAALSEAFSRDVIPWHLSSRHHIGQEGRGGRQVAAGR